VIRILLADADRVQREGMRLVLDAQPDMDVVAEAEDGLDAIATLRRVAIDAVLADVRMPEAGGFAVVEAIAGDARVRLTQRAAPTRVVLVTASDLDRYAASGLEAGAAAVLYKDADPQVLVDAVRSAAARTAPS
jgi:DNA-binding NarL/FixJ family response regulator